MSPLQKMSSLLCGVVVNYRYTYHTNPSSSPILHDYIRPTTTKLQPPQKCLDSAPSPEGLCWLICGQHENNGPVQLRFV